MMARTAAQLARRERQLSEARAALAAAGADLVELEELAAQVAHVAGTLALLPTAYLYGDPLARAARDVLALARQRDGAADPQHPPRPPRRASKGPTT